MKVDLIAILRVCLPRAPGLSSGDGTGPKRIRVGRTRNNPIWAGLFEVYTINGSFVLTDSLDCFFAFVA